MALSKFPGFIDIHVHLRDPGATHKEDFTTGSRAAIKGGFTYICDMPNNPIPTFTMERLEEKIVLAKRKAICDIGFHFGTNGQNLEAFPAAWQNPNVFGLKIYCNHTTGELLIEDVHAIEKIFKAWDSEKPILAHAEGDKLPAIIDLARIYNRRLHVCHISKLIEVEFVKKAKQAGILVTAGVTPHHLFLTLEDVKKLGSFALMKPALGTMDDKEALWEGLRDGDIDIAESDHAPHAKEEKAGSDSVFGVPGLETTLGLLLLAVKKRMLSLEKVIDLIYNHPQKIFSIPSQENTFVQLDPEKSYVAGAGGYETKCGWSPFDGWELYGQVEQVVLRGRSLIIGGKVIKSLS